MARKRKIVVGVDGSPQSEAALRWAVGEAAADRGEVRAVLVRARDELLPGTSYAIQPHGRRPVAQDEDYAGLLRESVRKTLQNIENPPLVEDLVADGDPATELIKESSAADLLVVGSHGARMVTELLLGSVATQCVRHAHCPVVVLTAESAQRLS
ncbi:MULTISPECIES: universal stress protein [Amycolatopsis]|uniref:Nucleotide-binding universal stress protein, UspA family n=2 Tax=Amycolatopsis TaxID=1813 RepID=A0A1I3KZS1_9PSEU|nr:universal stress protein [Amycolatopsis sacchari]SFI77874.1 Nucleotide-binding universal stress protein, UspA family [Amycolatopsis sacchari]